MPRLPNVNLGGISHALDSLRGLGCGGRRDSDTTFLCRGLPGTPRLPDLNLPGLPGSNPRGPNPNNPPAQNPNNPPAQNPNNPPTQNPNNPPVQDPNNPPVQNPNNPPVQNPNNPPVQDPNNPPEQNPDNPQEPNPDNPQEPEPDNPQEPDPDNPQEPDPDRPEEQDPNDPDPPEEQDPDDPDPPEEQDPDLHDDIVDDIELTDFYQRYFEMDISEMRFGTLASNMARLSIGPRPQSAQALVEHIENDPPDLRPNSANFDASVASTISSYYSAYGDHIRANILSTTILDGNPIEGPLGPRPDSPGYNPLNPGGGGPDFRDSIYEMMHRNDALLQLVGVAPPPPLSPDTPEWIINYRDHHNPTIRSREEQRRIPNPSEAEFYTFLAEIDKFLDKYIDSLKKTGLYEKINATLPNEPKEPVPTTFSTVVTSRSRGSTSSLNSEGSSTSTVESGVSTSESKSTSASQETGKDKDKSTSTSTNTNTSMSTEIRTNTNKEKLKMPKTELTTVTSSSVNMDSTAFPLLCLDESGNVEQGCRW